MTWFNWTDAERLSMAALGSRTEENLQAERLVSFEKSREAWRAILSRFYLEFDARADAAIRKNLVASSTWNEPIGTDTDNINEGDMVAIDMVKRTVSRV